MQNDTLSKLSDSFRDRFVANESIKSFQQLLEDVRNDPLKFGRNSAQYLKDVFDHYGHYEVRDITGEPIKRWRIFDLFSPVYGQERAQNKIYHHLSSFAENRINKIIFLHGPNGSAKTSLVSSIMMAMEDYSKLPKGAVYTFNWIFSDVGEKEVRIGFNQDNITYNEETLAFTKPEDITFKLPCSMKDNPLLLIPKPERVQFFKSLGMEKIPAHLLEQEPCQKCQEIFTQLAINYKGDWAQIVRHIQVERFYYSKRFRKGLISIDPQRNIDASSRPLNLEQSYHIPRILSMSAMYEPFGDLIDANRGVVEFSELLKRSPEANKYLLTTAENGCISLPSFTAYLDCVIFSTDNQLQLTQFKSTADWPSFNGRLAFVRVPYLIRWTPEKQSCDKLIKSYAREIHIAPHTAEVLSLWAVFTRLRVSKKNLANKLTLFEKALLYDTGEPPEGWKSDERQTLLKDLKEIALEYDEEHERYLDKFSQDDSYEGRGGASYREIENIVVNAVNARKYLSPLGIFTSIAKLIKDDSIYEFVRLSKSGSPDPRTGIVFEKGFYDQETILTEAKVYYAEQVEKDLRSAAGLVKADEYVKLFEKYLQHVKAFLKEERLHNPLTGNWEKADDSLMRNIETKINVDASDAKQWRNAISHKIASWVLQHNSIENIPYQTLFSDAIEALKKNSSDVDIKDQLKRIQKHVVLFNTEDWKLVPEEDRIQVTQTVENLKTLGYTEESLKEAIVFLMNMEQGN